MSIPEITATPTKDELWQYAAKALDAGDFTWLDKLLRSQNSSLIDLLEANGEPKEYMDEALAWACMVGRTSDAAILLDKGVDPYAGMKTGLSGFHYAVSSGRLETVKMLVERKIPMEIENMYGGTVWEQALWSAVNEHKNSHADIIEALIDAGAVIEPGTLEWWNEQNMPSHETKKRVTEMLIKAGCIK
jgi:ankyrin repeat protein